MTSQWIITYNTVEMTLGTFASKDRNGVVTCDEKNLPWFVVGYDFNPTCCVFSKNLLDKNHIQPQTIGNPIYVVQKSLTKTK